MAKLILRSTNPESVAGIPTASSNKDAPLSNSEVDNNFLSLNRDKLERESNLSEINQAGSSAQNTARTNLGASTVGSNLFTVQNPNAVRFLRINADNSINTRSAAEFRGDIGAGTVTQVNGTGSVFGITLTGSVTGSGDLTLGGSFSAPIANISDSTSVGQNLVKLTPPSAVRFLRINADNSVNARTAEELRSDIGAGTGNGTVTQVNGTGTISGITLTGSVTGSGDLTLGGSFSAPIAQISDATTVGQNLVKIPNQTENRFLRINGSNNTISVLSAQEFRDAIGAGTGTGTGTVTQIDTGNGITGGPITGTGTIDLDGQALALHNLNTNGVIVRTSAGNVAARTITQGTGITITDGDGVSGNPTITNSAPNANHTGEVTGSAALTITDKAVTNAKLADMAANTIKGRRTSAGEPENLTAAQVRTILNVADGATANAGTVTSITGDNGLTGTVTTTGNIGMANMAANTIKGRGANAGVPQDLSVSDVKNILDLNNVTNESKTDMFASPTFTGTVISNQIRVRNAAATTKDSILLTPTNIGTDNRAITIATPTTALFNDFTLRLANGNTTLVPGIMVATDDARLTNARQATNTDTQLTSLGVGVAASGTAGEILASGDISANFSDDRLKTRLGSIENALDKVCSLSGFYYQANETAQALGYKPVRKTGVSAQDVQKVLPEVVVPAPIDEQYLTIQYERMIPLLIEAIKELKQEINDLKK